MITVVYHSADYDGIFCREIARHFLGDVEVAYIGWNFGDTKIEMPSEGQVYIMDLSPECIQVRPFENEQRDRELAFRIIWIDHHKSSIEKWPNLLPGYRIDGVSACRLAWQWFLCCDGNLKNPPPRNQAMLPAGVLPQKQDFVNRNVSEPYAVQLAGEYDIWDKRNPDAETFQYALRVKKLTSDIWSELLEDGIEVVLQVQRSQIMVQTLMECGRAAQTYAKQENESLVTHRSYMTEWEGLKFLTMNALRCNSLTFEAKDVPETGHDALLAYYFNGKCWTVSLYHATHRKDIDLSQIAVKFGGGGHRGACGFTCTKLPFLTQ